MNEADSGFLDEMLANAERAVLSGRDRAELRPPVEHERQPLHWLTDITDRPTVARWDRSEPHAWILIGDEIDRAPSQMAGYRYLGPAEWVNARTATLEVQNGRLLNENAILRANPPMTRIENGTLYAWDADGGRWLTAADDPPAAEGPDDPAHRSVRETIDRLTKGLVTPPARRALGDALDRANAPPTGRAAADRGLGRAIGGGRG